MDMKIRTALIREHRTRRLMSQEELAAACGLSLRTIQRIENDGKASQESLRALAAVFEVDPDSLRASEDFTPYSHTQIGWTIILLMVTVSGLILGVQPRAGLVVLALGLLVGALFGTLSIAVSETELSWRFGLGLIRKREPISEIREAEKCVNRWFHGFGIRFIPPGRWLYNVSGMDAVQVTMKSGRRFRLGTDEPDYLYKSLNAAILLAESRQK